MKGILFLLLFSLFSSSEIESQVVNRKFKFRTTTTSEYPIPYFDTIKIVGNSRVFFYDQVEYNNHFEFSEIKFELDQNVDTLEWWYKSICGFDKIKKISVKNKEVIKLYLENPRIADYRSIFEEYVGSREFKLFVHESITTAGTNIYIYYKKINNSFNYFISFSSLPLDTIEHSLHTNDNLKPYRNIDADLGKVFFEADNCKSINTSFKRSFLNSEWYFEFDDGEKLYLEYLQKLSPFIWDIGGLLSE